MMFIEITRREEQEPDHSAYISHKFIVSVGHTKHGKYMEYWITPSLDANLRGNKYLISEADFRALVSPCDNGTY